MIQMTERQIGRFWKNVSKRSENECWNWKLSIASMGYGQVRMRGKTLHCHRVAWMLANGPIDEGMFILHKCDNKSCCNPNHLFQGTQRDNVEDMINKNRHSHGEKHSEVMKNTASKGENHYRSRLNATQVKQIREIHEIGELGYGPIARQFGVSTGTIQAIVSRRNWKHI